MLLKDESFADLLWYNELSANEILNMNDNDYDMQVEDLIKA